MSISKNLIETIKNTSLISDIIGKYLPLKKRGVNFFSNCPFHQEKSPSFSVNNDKKIFYCFGCHESGDVFTFLMKYKNISYPEAIKEVASVVGISVQEETYEKVSKKANLDNSALTINEIATASYNQNIGKHSPAYKYILSRGLDEHDVHKFKLGYAPESWDFIYRALTEKNYKNETILYSNLTIKSDKNNTFYDRFRNKLIFPILNEKDHVVGFGSRVLDDSLPKYINSPESNLFNKRKVLYGINFAKNHFRQKKYAIITEGYFDVITCHKFGFDTAVATLGTALTRDHLHILSRYDIKHIYLVFDADEAGINACFKAIALSSDYEFSISVINLTRGMDPMDFLLKEGKDAFKERMDNALSPIDFVINSVKEKFDLSKAESRIDFIKHIFSYIKTINNALLKDEFLKKISEVTGIDETSIRNEYHKGEKTNYYSVKKNTTETGQTKREKLIMFLLIANENIFIQYGDKIHYDFFHDPFCKKIIKAAQEKFDEIKEYDFSEFIKAIEMILDDNEEKIYFFNEIMKDIYNKKADLQIEILLQEVQLEKIEDMLKGNSRAIMDKEKIGDEIGASELQTAQQFLSVQRHKIKRSLQKTKKF